jgi:hypothetical protein
MKPALGAGFESWSGRQDCLRPAPPSPSSAIQKRVAQTRGAWPYRAFVISALRAFEQARRAPLETTKPPPKVEAMLFLSVGKTGFEPATPWSQTRCATGLRYFPNGSRQEKSFRLRRCKGRGFRSNCQKSFGRRSNPEERRLVVKGNRDGNAGKNG